MVEIPGSEYTVDVDLVLIAAGFLGSENYVTKAFGVEVNATDQREDTSPGKYETSVKNIFAAGDMHTRTVSCGMGDPGRTRSGPEKWMRV